MLSSMLMLVVVACFTKSCHCYYTIIGSSFICPDSIYSVAVVSDATVPTSVLLTIKNDKSYAISESVTIQPKSRKTIDFSIGSLEEAAYTFTANGLKGFDFKNETYITLRPKKQSVFIQSDKAMYKPGDKVQFRVIVVDRDLIPDTFNNMDIYITDSSQNRIEQWLNVDTTMGVYNGELQLASTPCLGDWTIFVVIDEEVTAKSFEIAEYVLPKFEVTITSPVDTSLSDETFIVTINAVYTYGKNVKGVAEVTASETWQALQQITKQVDINGIAHVEFKISDFKTDLSYWAENFEITASIREELTGVVIKASTVITVYRYKFNINIIDDDFSFTPGPATVNLQFLYNDGSPFIDTVNPIKLGYYNRTDYDQTNLTYLATGKMNSKGVAVINVKWPNIENSINLNVQFLDYSDVVGYYYKRQPLADNVLSLRLITQNHKIGDDISVEITSVKDLLPLNYLVSARGKLILSDRKEVRHRKSVTITIKATFEMVSSATFVAYCISPNGDIISSSLWISVDGLNNFVTIKTSSSEKQPGESVDITISTKPLSQVCLLGVDQSVTLVKTGNDIQKSDVIYALETYFYGPIFSGPIGMDLAGRKKRSLHGWPIYRRWPDFVGADLFILTNCNEPPQPSYNDNWYTLTGTMNTLDGPRRETVGIAPPTQSLTSNIRKYFPETWIWDCRNSSSGSLKLQEKVPDTITSWYLTGFATNNKFGLGVTDDKTVFKVFKKFFISLNLPYSVKRGEALLLQVVIFNYLPRKVTAKVMLDNSLKEFEFIDPHTQALKDKGCPPSIESSRTKTVTVNANDGVSLSFLINPVITGPMTIKITATSPVAGDAIQVPLLVIPEGVAQYKNKAQFVDLRSNKQFSADLIVDVPKNAVSNSTKVQISAIGDMMGVALKNIDNIIRIPSGCGEQTMMGLAPDVVIYDYLTNVGLLTPSLNTTLLDYMKMGYQGELSYKHDDHSFSCFGNRDAAGSSWLTAFVLRIFIQASAYITIDSAVITNGLDWLAEQQLPNGCFNEFGVVHSNMQGEAAQGVALTAYIVVTFLTDKTKAQTYANVILNALDYVYETLQTKDDLYSLSIAAYAAQLANYKHKDALLKKLDALARVQGDQKWWEKVKLITPNDPWSQPSSVNVEITAYSLLTYIAAGRLLDGVPIMKWLLAQQSSWGGFASTQDTIVGITALAAFAAKISVASSMSCSFKYGEGSSTINMDKTNSLVLQSVELPTITKSVKVTCTGSGFSLVQLSYQFNLITVEVSPRFVLNVEVDKRSNDYYLVLNICTSYIAGDDGDTSSMALIEAEFPTGFTADTETIIEALQQVKGFKMFEAKNSNTVAVIYLDNISTTQKCLQLSAYRMFQTAYEKPVAVIVQDYYSNDRRKTTFYSRTPKDACSICDSDECTEDCKKLAKDIKCPVKNPSDASKNILKQLEEWLKNMLAKYC